MTEYVHLIGTEQMQNAAHTFSSAVERLSHIQLIDEFRLQRTAEDLLSRLETILADDRKKRGLPE